jgi:flagellar biosynthetic protein FliP
MSSHRPAALPAAAPRSPAEDRPGGLRSALGPALRIVLAVSAVAMPALALAQASPLQVVSTPSAGGGQTFSVPVQTLLFFSALTLLPAALLLMTSFTRIVIVLSLLRQALGTQNSPPNQVLVGLSLFLTFFIMGPVFDRIYTEAYVPYSEKKIEFEEAVQRAGVPVKRFMLKQTREPDLALFMKLSRAETVQDPEQAPFRVVVPAFVTSELKTAFQIAFLVFIPFLIIDMVVASVLMSMGMMMLSPVLIAMPFKLMLFVLADGWTLLVGSLVASFGS